MNKLFLKKAIVIVASPRSGSQHLAQVVAAGTGWPVVEPKTEAGFGHFSLNSAKLIKFKKYIVYQHIFPTPRNIKYIYSISLFQPILIWRNAYDWTASMASWFIKNGRSPWGIPSDYSLPTATLSQPVWDRRFSSAVDFIIDYELPIYIRFLHGWSLRPPASTTWQRPYFVNFKDFIKAPYNYALSLSEDLELKLDTANLAEVVSNPKNLSAEYKSGTRHTLNANQKERIERLCQTAKKTWLLDSV